MYLSFPEVKTRGCSKSNKNLEVRVLSNIGLFLTLQIDIMDSEAQHLSPTTTTESSSNKYVVNLNSNTATKDHETQELESAIISIKLPSRLFENQKRLSTIFKTISNALKLEPSTKEATCISTSSEANFIPDTQDQDNPKVITISN